MVSTRANVNGGKTISHKPDLGKVVEKAVHYTWTVVTVAEVIVTTLGLNMNHMVSVSFITPIAL